MIKVKLLCDFNNVVAVGQMLVTSQTLWPLVTMNCSGQRLHRLPVACLGCLWPQIASV